MVAPLNLIKIISNGVSSNQSNALQLSPQFPELTNLTLLYRLKYINY